MSPAAGQHPFHTLTAKRLDHTLTAKPAVPAVPPVLPVSEELGSAMPAVRPVLPDVRG